VPCSLRLAVLAATATVAAGAPAAHAAPVVLVDDQRVERVEDPFVPTRAQIELGPAPGRPAAGARPAGRAQRAVGAALGRALRARAIRRSSYRGYVRSYRAARATLRGLRGARRRELGYVVGSVERLALSRRLSASRLPAVFLQLRRNSSYWRSKPFPGVGDQVAFRGSEILFQYFPGRGLQFHPLANFKKANQLHGACQRRSGGGKPVCGARPPGPRPGTPCRPARLRRLLDELTRLAVRRGRGFIAWEYLFHFGGGSPPWMSGMAQSTAIAALGRGARMLNRPAYDRTAKAALGAFESRWPTGVRARGPLGGVHYLQYSFAPRLFIFNAFMQALIGLRDYGNLADDARAKGLFTRAEPEARREVPSSDVGDWSRYSYRGRESTREYHELLREILQGMGRRVGEPYCAYAIRYRRYQTQPPRIRSIGPLALVTGRRARVRFSLSKLSIVELQIFKGDRRVMGALETFRRGTRSFGWRPRSAGSYTVRIGAKELRTGRSLRGRASATIEVSD
jgi:hypothetical protein